MLTRYRSLSRQRVVDEPGPQSSVLNLLRSWSSNAPDGPGTLALDYPLILYQSKLSPPRRPADWSRPTRLSPLVPVETAVLNDRSNEVIEIGNVTSFRDQAGHVGPVTGGLALRREPPVGISPELARLIGGTPQTVAIHRSQTDVLRDCDAREPPSQAALDRGRRRRSCCRGPRPDARDRPARRRSAARGDLKPRTP